MSYSKLREKQERRKAKILKNGGRMPVDASSTNATSIRSNQRSPNEKRSGKVLALRVVNLMFCIALAFTGLLYLAEHVHPLVGVFSVLAVYTLWQGLNELVDPVAERAESLEGGFGAVEAKDQATLRENSSEATINRKYNKIGRSAGAIFSHLIKKAGK